MLFKLAHKLHALKLGCLFLVIPGFCFYEGTRCTHEYLTCPEPTAMTVSSPAPATRWVRVSGCSLVTSTCAALDRYGSPRLYFALARPGAPPDEPTRLVLATRAPEKLAYLEAASSLRAAQGAIKVWASIKEETRYRPSSEALAQDEANALAELIRVRRELSRPQVLTGLLAPGSDLDAKRIPEEWHVAPDFMILEDGEAPSLARGAAYLAFGAAWILIPVAAVLLARRRRRKPPLVSLQAPLLH